MPNFNRGEILFYRMCGDIAGLRTPCIFIKQEEDRYYCCFMDSRDESGTYCDKLSLNELPESMYKEFSGIEEFITNYQPRYIHSVEDGCITRR